MAISTRQIEHLADLAHLDITEAEMEKYAEEISAILDYFTQLQELDTSAVEPMAQVFDLQNVMREDKSSKSGGRNRVLAEAPELEDKQIKVPAVFEK